MKQKYKVVEPVLEDFEGEASLLQGEDGEYVIVSSVDYVIPVPNEILEHHPEELREHNRVNQTLVFNADQHGHVSNFSERYSERPQAHDKVIGMLERGEIEFYELDPYDEMQGFEVAQAVKAIKALRDKEE